MKIAALVPVYREPKALASLCERLSKDPFPDKEIVVVVDGCTTEPIEWVLARLSRLGGIRIVQGLGHLGKAAALNLAASEIEADALLFLDNDIYLPSREDFLSTLAQALDSRDLVELPKVGVGSGPLAAMMKLEFLQSLRSAEALTEGLGACPSMNGAAFAIRKSLFDSLGGFAPVVNEDMDLAARAFLAGASFGSFAELAVGNAVSETASDWGRQRKRWMVNNALWSKSYLIQSLKRSPEAAQALAANAVRSALPWISILVGSVPAVALAAYFSPAPLWIAAAGALGAGGAWSYTAWGYEACAKRHGADFGYAAFLAYTLVYEPLVAAANLATSVAVILGAEPRVDWKIVGRDETLASSPRRQRSRGAEAPRRGGGRGGKQRLELAQARARAQAEPRRPRY